LRLIKAEIPTDDLDAASTLLGMPGTVLDDDDLETARTEVRLALEACDDSFVTYQEKLEDAVTHAERARDAVHELNMRASALHSTGHLRIGNASAIAVVAALNGVTQALEDWLDWARRELADLD